MKKIVIIGAGQLGSRHLQGIAHRELLVDTNEHSYRLDFISNKLMKKNQKGLEEKFSFSNLERNQLFEEMHRDIMEKRNKRFLLKNYE